MPYEELKTPNISAEKSILSSNDAIINFAKATAGRFVIYDTSYKENPDPLNPLDYTQELATHLDYFQDVVTRAQAERTKLRPFKIAGVEFNPKIIKADKLISGVSKRAIIISLAVLTTLGEKLKDQKSELRPLLEKFYQVYKQEGIARGHYSTQQILSASTNSVTNDADVIRYSSNYGEARQATIKSGANIMRQLTGELADINLLEPIEHWLLSSE